MSSCSILDATVRRSETRTHHAARGVPSRALSEVSSFRVAFLDPSAQPSCVDRLSSVRHGFEKCSETRARQVVRAGGGNMPDSIDDISDREDREYARKHRVGPGSQIIFTSLRNALKEKIVKYNERYRARWEFNFPDDADAILIHDDLFHQTAYGLTIKTTMEPTACLKVDFPIRSGEMELRLRFGSDEEVVDAISSISRATVLNFTSTAEGIQRTA